MDKICLLFFIILSTASVYSQDAGQQRQTDAAALEYMNVAGNQAAIFNAPLHEGNMRASNHPYMIDERFAKARLSYNNVVYPEAMLRYDMFRNELTIQSPELRAFVLFPENVDYAELHGRRIIYFRRDSLPGCPPTGYYVLLHSGDRKVLQRQSASIMHDTRATSMNRYYVFSTHYFLYKDGSYHAIRNKRGLLNALHPYKKELNRFISSNRWRFNRDAETLIVQTIIQYEKISEMR